MPIHVQSASPTSLDMIVEQVAGWQFEGGPVQLHPGDLGWNWSFGEDWLARALRVWRDGQDGQVLAVGLLDEDRLLRLAVAPAVDDDDTFAAQLLSDLSEPARGVLPAGESTVETRAGAALRELLHASGWVADEAWTPLRRDLSSPVEDCGLRVEVLDADRATDRLVEDRVDVQRASFLRSTFTVERWRAMAASAPYRRARCLVGYDDAGAAVAAVTVWSAGPGRPGLLEPLGVHRDHRGRGHGRAISLAAAAALRDLGSSSATVCTPSRNSPAVATYVSAGFQRLPDVTDLRRTASGAVEQSD